MNLLIPAITGALIAWYSIHGLRWHLRFKLDFKPFNCTTCFSMWLAIGLYFTPEFIVNFLFVAILAASIGVWLEK